MDVDILATAAVPAVPPAVPPASTDTATRRSRPDRVVHAPVTPIPPPRQVELSFHEDLNVLMTRVLDAQTGDVVREYPVRQVLDMVADVMARMRAQEERSSR